MLQIVVQLSCHVTRQLFDYLHYLRQEERRRGRRREGNIAASRPATGQNNGDMEHSWNIYSWNTRSRNTHASNIHGLSVYPLVRFVSSVPKKATQRNWAAAILTLISVPYAMAYYTILCYGIAYGSGWAGLGWTGLAVVWFSYLGKSFHSRCSTADLYLKIPPEIPPCVSNYLSSCGHTTQW